MQATYYVVMILMQFQSPEACEAYAQNLKNHQNCVEIKRYEEPRNLEPLKRPDIIEGMKI